jgi:lysophospholipase L1-like esterase
MPAVNGEPGDHLLVIGDSISAGIATGVAAWPTILQQQTSIPVKNLSRPGAGVAEARLMAAQVEPQDTIVLIEIGGNDLLSGISSADFERGLDSLLSLLVNHSRTVVMFELPLLPHRIAYGQVQRHLAGRYGVFLIPKHYFTNVISGAEATSDGLHLSAVGAHRMAALVGKALSRVLKPAMSVTNATH